MPKYTINGKSFNSAAPLSDDDLEELAAEAGATAPVAETPAPVEEPKKSFADRAMNVIKGIRTGGENEDGTHNEEARKDLIEASGMPARGLKGVGVATERAILGDSLNDSLNRGTEATKVGYEPKDGEKLGNFAGEMADPRTYPLNAVGGKALGLAGTLAKKGMKSAGNVAAEGVEMLTGVHPHNTKALFNEPVDVAFAKGKDILRRVFGKGSAGKDMQAAKINAGVTPEEERMIAQVDLGGYKKVADDMAKKVASGDDLSVGEMLAGKKAAGKVSSKGEGSAKAIYGKDFAKMDEMLAEKAPAVKEAQKEISKIKTAEAFMTPFARKGGSAKGHFVRNVLGGGMLATGNPAGAIFSPLTAGVGTVAASAATKGAELVGDKVINSPAGRAALIAALNSKGKKK